MKKLLLVSFVFVTLISWITLSMGADHIGQTPIIDMVYPNIYTAYGKTYTGGLYSGYSNTPPPTHLSAILNEISKIQPLDAFGNPSPDGKIAMLAITMSNGKQEFNAFIDLMNNDPDMNSNIVLVNGGQPGITADIWAGEEPVNPDPWSVVNNTILPGAGVTKQQVQVIWLKNMHSMTEDEATYIARMKTSLYTIAHRVKTEHYPNTKIVYCSSRIYGGYDVTGRHRLEPCSYESGFAFQELITDQISGVANLNWDPAKGPVKSAILAWGPYLWANGVMPRSDGLTWLSSDYQNDGIHPAASGELKVATMLKNFFKTNPITAPWFTKGAPPPGPSITVNNPNSTTVWAPNSTQTIEWTTTGTVGNVKIELTTNGGTAWTTLVANTPCDGLETVTVPNTPSTACKVKVSELDGSPSGTSSTFTIGTTPPPGIIANLSVKDNANASKWSIQSNLQVENAQYGDNTTITLTTVPPLVAGNAWIRTALGSRSYTGDPLVTFTVTQNADVYVAHDDSISPKPSWLTGWNLMADDLKNNRGQTFSLYQKTFTANSTVSLGPNGNTTKVMYTIIVKAL